MMISRYLVIISDVLGTVLVGKAASACDWHMYMYNVILHCIVI